MMRVLLTGVIAAMVGCTEKNPNYCDDSTQCPSGTTCNVPAHTCVVSPDASADANEQGDGSTCLGVGAFRVCLPAQPTLPITFSDGALLDTTTSTLCLANQPVGWLAGGQPEACFVVATNITIPNVVATGTRPLVFVATHTVSFTGELDVASHTEGNHRPGPGSSYSECSVFARSPSDSTSGGGGGAGASFRTKGGAGGAGNSVTQGGLSANADAALPMLMRGGCRGQSGGAGQQAAVNGGNGGGAAYVLASDSIVLGPTATLNASGAGGVGGGLSGGGGGGGAGGMLLLHAPTISISAGAIIIANGGGGGGGGSTTTAGLDGNQANPNSPLTPAAGGAGGATGMGGTGAVESSPAQPGLNAGSGHGGAGGGGALGYIEANVALTNATISPTPVIQ